MKNVETAELNKIDVYMSALDRSADVIDFAIADLVKETRAIRGTLFTYCDEMRRIINRELADGNEKKLVRLTYLCNRLAEVIFDCCYGCDQADDPNLTEYIKNRLMLRENCTMKQIYDDFVYYNRELSSALIEEDQERVALIGAGYMVLADQLVYQNKL